MQCVEPLIIILFFWKGMFVHRIKIKSMADAKLTKLKRDLAVLLN